jgi:hypothetical protein
MVIFKYLKSGEFEFILDGEEMEEFLESLKQKKNKISFN